MTAVPNIFHFVFGMAPDFGGKPFALVHHLAIRSAVALNRPDKVLFHCAWEPTGPWWDATRPFVNVHKVLPPEEIFGRPLQRAEHRGDVVRIEALLEHGGVYLDLDTISVRPLGPLMEHEFVIGEERTRGSRSHGLSNAVMLAAPGSRFLRRWHDSYRTFDGAYWNTHSVVVPRLLAQDAEPGEVHVEPVTSFHFPSWSEPELAALFEEDRRFSDAFVHHLWASKSWERYLAALTPEAIRRVDTTYNRIARQFLA